MKLYVTYGQGYEQHNCYSVVEAASIEACRRIVNDVTKGRYAFYYTEENFAGQVERWGLREIPLQPQTREEGSA